MRPQVPAKTVEHRLRTGNHSRSHSLASENADNVVSHAVAGSIGDIFSHAVSHPDENFSTVSSTEWRSINSALLVAGNTNSIVGLGAHAVRPTIDA
eukprot:8591901-Pyramimonas_sp.AAC.1